jgi:hypothetical protein
MAGSHCALGVNGTKRGRAGGGKAGEDPSSPKAGGRLRARGCGLGMEGWVSGRGAAD